MALFKFLLLFLFVFSMSMSAKKKYTIHLTSEDVSLDEGKLRAFKVLRRSICVLQNFTSDRDKKRFDLFMSSKKWRRKLGFRFVVFNQRLTTTKHPHRRPNLSYETFSVCSKQKDFLKHENRWREMSTLNYKAKGEPSNIDEAKH